MNREKEEGLSYQEKKSILTLISNTVIFGGYSWYVYATQLGIHPELKDSPAFWASVVLIMIPVSIVAKIIISILFSIGYTISAKEREPGFMDERDKLIMLKSARNSYSVFVLCIMLGMVALVMKMHISAFFLCIIVGGFVAELVSVFTQLYFYRKGI